MTVLSIIDRIAANVAMSEGVYPWADQRDDTKAEYQTVAVSILEDIADPTPAMIAAGSAADEHPIGTHNPFNIWHAMIEAAIAEHCPPVAAAEERSTENLIRNIIKGLDEKGAIGVSLDRAALEGMLDPSTAQINVEYIGGKKS